MSAFIRTVVALLAVLSVVVLLGAWWGSDQQVTQYVPQGGVHAGRHGIALDDVWVDSPHGVKRGGSAVVRFDVADETSHADELIGVRTRVAREAQLMVNGHAVDHVRIGPHSDLDLEWHPHADGVRLTGLRQALSRGDWFPITFRFAHSAPITMQITVGPLAAHPHTGHAAPGSSALGWVHARAGRRGRHGNG